MKCQFCDKECKPLGLSSHELYCKINPERRDKSGANNPNYGKNGKKGGNQYTVAAKEGRLINMSDETKAKISASAKVANAGSNLWPEERRKAHSVLMSKVAADNPGSYTAEKIIGRVPMYDIVDSFGNATKVRGKWEYNVACWMSSNGIAWTNKVQHKFLYYWKGSMRRYFPDFYLPDFNLYVEVKGYEVERDYAKWESMSHLVVIDQKRYRELMSL